MNLTFMVKFELNNAVWLDLISCYCYLIENKLLHLVGYFLFASILFYLLLETYRDVYQRPQLHYLC